jgi:hypothetical protein
VLPARKGQEELKTSQPISFPASSKWAHLFVRLAPSPQRTRAPVCVCECVCVCCVCVCVCVCVFDKCLERMPCAKMWACATQSRQPAAPAADCRTMLATHSRCVRSQASSTQPHIHAHGTSVVRACACQTNQYLYSQCLAALPAPNRRRPSIESENRGVFSQGVLAPDQRLRGARPWLNDVRPTAIGESTTEILGLMVETGKVLVPAPVVRDPA